jgi:pyruvate,orthophosphate dikinase
MSFGTNDLTQLTYGFSRDDSGSFLPQYRAAGLLDADPFATIDVDGVGGLIKIALERARSVAPAMEVGVCGEHGGDPQSIAFFQSAGFDYVSCSAARVPVARLAAAQATLRLQVGERDILAD